MDARVQTGLSDRVAEEIRALMARRRMSGRQLATRLGVSPAWISYRLTGSQEIGLNDLERIAAALDADPVELLRSAASTTNRYQVGPHRVEIRSGRAPGSRSRFRQAAAA